MKLLVILMKNVFNAPWPKPMHFGQDDFPVTRAKEFEDMDIWELGTIAKTTLYNGMRMEGVSDLFKATYLVPLVHGIKIAENDLYTL